MDFLVVNGNASILRQVNRFSILHQIPLLTFTLNASEILRGNPQAYAFTPSSNTQCREAGKFFASKFKIENVLAVTTNSAKETERAKAFAAGWNAENELKAKVLDYSKGTFDELLRSMIKWKNNLLFVPSSNEDLVNTLFRKLNDTIAVYPVTIIGIPTWLYFESIDPAIIEKLNTHLFLASGISEDSERNFAVRKYFRTEYLMEPDENAYQGYDAMMFIALKCNQKKEQEEKQFDGLYSSYNFVSENGMNENQKIHFLKYKDYQLVEVK
jgi:hypothetical protein